MKLQIPKYCGDLVDNILDTIICVLDDNGTEYNHNLKKAMMISLV